jgi:hypothetical protein
MTMVIKMRIAQVNLNHAVNFSPRELKQQDAFLPNTVMLKEATVMKETFYLNVQMAEKS